MTDGRIAKFNSGISQKPDDRFCLPLCGKHHREQHQIGDEKKFWKSYRTDPILLALAIYSISGDAEEAERIIRERVLDEIVPDR